MFTTISIITNCKLNRKKIKARKQTILLRFCKTDRMLLDYLLQNNSSKFFLK